MATTVPSSPLGALGSHGQVQMAIAQQGVTRRRETSVCGVEAVVCASRQQHARRSAPTAGLGLGAPKGGHGIDDLVRARSSHGPRPPDGFKTKYMGETVAGAFHRRSPCARKLSRLSRGDVVLL